MISISKQVGKKPGHYEKITEIIIKHELSERDSSQRYIYHNVPTCDGTSIVKALSERFNLEQYCLEQSYPDWENEGSKLLTFLRDPWELQISLYDNEIRLGTISVDEPIRDRLFLRKNFMANLLKCNDSNYLSVLRQYFGSTRIAVV